MPAHHTPLHQAVAEVVAAGSGVAPSDLKVDPPPPPRGPSGKDLARWELGDFAVGCFPIAKAKGITPAAAAAAIAAAFVPTPLLASATASGPFVNLRANRAAAYRWLVDAATTGALLPTDLGAGKAICIDYSSPNISKQLAYHHIRSTVIGHALAQIFRALGYDVVGINHLGDWGTTHGMLIAAWQRWGPIEPLDIEGLNGLYVRFREAMKDNPALEGEGHAWFKRLEDGDADARALWQRFYDVSWAEFAAMYELLGIRFDEVRGESAYEPELPGVLAELRQKGLVTESDGALVVELPDEKTPVLLLSRDGTTFYATRDFAAAKHRWNTFHFARSLYVVDRGQALHFRQLFKLLRLAGYEWAAQCEHVPFGLVRFGGKKTATRAGNVVLLKEVFQFAEDEVVRNFAAHPDLSADQLAATARQVGIGAVMFANLVTQRDKDVEFEWDRVLSLEGDSGPYLQYSHARCASIARKAGPRSDEPVDYGTLVHDGEWTVARRLLDFPDIVVRASESCEPHVICHYLLELASDFSHWYAAGSRDAALRVLCDDPATRHARLALTAAVQATLARGLALLGIGAPDQM